MERERYAIPAKKAREIEPPVATGEGMKAIEEVVKTRLLRRRA
ncbi:hypothetical protein [Nitrospira sp. Nam74]